MSNVITVYFPLEHVDNFLFFRHGLYIVLVHGVPMFSIKSHIFSRLIILIGVYKQKIYFLSNSLYRYFFIKYV